MSEEGPRPRRPEDALSVIVIPTGDIGDQLLEAARQWTVAGILSAAIWVRPEDVVVPPGRAPEIRGHHLGSWGIETPDLFETLGQHRRRLVRVVAAQVLAEPGSVAPLQIQAAMAVRDWVTESVPRAPSGRGGLTGTEVRAINLVTAATGLAEMPSTLVFGAWDVNVVTSPEDRPDPGRANRFVRPEANLIPVALLSIGSVAGLFPGVLDAPFDDIAADSSAVLGKALLVRTTARLLIGERVARNLASAATDQALLRGAPTLAQPERFVAGDPRHLVERLLDWLDTTDSGSLIPSPVEEATREPVEFIAVRAGVREFLAFYGHAMVTLAWSLVRFVQRSAEELATQAVVGSDSGKRLIITPDTSPGLGDELVKMEELDIGQRRVEMAMAQREPVRMPTAQLWRDLRSVSLGALDGGGLPSGAHLPTEGSRTILIGDPRKVVPDPDERFVIDTEVRSALDDDLHWVEAMSPERAEALKRSLERAVDQCRARVADARARLAALLAEKDDAIEDVKARESAEARLAAAQSVLDKVEKCHEDYMAWMSPRNSSLMWQLAARIRGRADAAAVHEQSAATSAVAPSGLDASKPDRLRRTFTIGGWLTIGVLVLAIGLLNLGGLTEGTYPGLSWSLGAAVVAAMILTVLVRMWYVGVVAFLHGFESGAIRRATNSDLFVRANAERRRFEAILGQLDQWSNVLAWSVHRPWASGADGDGEELPIVDPALVPAALVMAEPALDERGRERVVRFAIADLTRAGWRGRAYQRLVAAHVSDRDQPSPEALIAAVEAIDRDEGQPEGDRARFLLELSKGHIQQRAAERVVEETANHLRMTRLGIDREMSVEMRAAQPRQDAMADNAFLAEALVPATPFAKETWSEHALVEGAHERITAHYWTGIEPGPRAPTAAREVAGVVVADLLEQSPLIDLSLRVDVSEWLDVRSLRLFGKAPVEGLMTRPPDDADPSIFT